MTFAYPWFMAAGGALVSAPILIHLINRMRFKRIRWAAMEFLLKSQKRNRRKLIIEQLILLGLRCLLVLLVGLLLGALQFGGDTGQTAFHFVVIDDTPSMGDRFVDAQGNASNSFEVAKDQVKTLADTLAKASTPQEMRVVLLSDPGEAVFPDDGKPSRQLDGKARTALEARLKDLHPAAVHVDPIQAVEKAREVFANQPRGKKVLHFVSDFRERDWKTGPDVEALNKAIDALTGTGANLSLIDVADARRGPNGENIAPHPNLSIQELRPTTTIATEGAPVEFTVGVFNHSTAPKTTVLHVFTRSIFVKEDGKIDDREALQEDLSAYGVFTRQEGAGDAAPADAKSKTDKLPPGQLTEHKFQLILQKKQKGQDVKPNDPPEERERKRRADAEFVQVRVQIDDDSKDAGFQADNVRDVVVALVRKVPVLIVDGAPESSRKKNGDLWYLRRALDAAVSYDMDRCTVEELDKIKLDQYPDIYLVNVSEIKNKETVQKLADYVARGGSVAYFLGDKTLPEFYNRLFSNPDGDKAFAEPKDASKEQHLFPVLLETDPSPPMSPEEIENRLINDKQPKILFPDESHPIIRGRSGAPTEKGGLVRLEDRLRYLTINRYWRCQSRSKWDPEPYQSQPVVVLPNRNSIDQYKRAAQDYMTKVVKQAADLAGEDVKYEPYRKRIDAAHSAMVDALTSPYLDDLIRVFDDLVHDPGAKDDADRPSMPELWAHPKMKALKDEIDAFRDTLQYGDPLVVTRPYGKGRVLAFLTTAGTSPRGLPPVAWNDWAGSPIAGSYPVFIQQMQEYLIGTAEQRSRPVGTDLALPELDAKRYQPTVRRFFQSQPSPWNKAPIGPAGPGAPQPAATGMPALTLQPSGPDAAPTYRQVLRNVNQPGVYTFEFTPKADPGDPAPAAELQAYAFNIDTNAESDLSRAPNEALLRKAPGGSGLNVGGKVALRRPAPASTNSRKSRRTCPRWSGSSC